MGGIPGEATAISNEDYSKITFPNFYKIFAQNKIKEDNFRQDSDYQINIHNLIQHLICQARGHPVVAPKLIVLNIVYPVYKQ